MILSSAFLGVMVDAAARSLLLAATVGMGLLVLRTRNVVAQKAAWMLVLASAMLMPVVAPWAERMPWVPAQAIMNLPRSEWPAAHRARSAETARNAPVSRAVSPAMRLETALPPAVYREPAAASPGGTHFPAPTVSHVSSDATAMQNASRTAESAAPGFTELHAGAIAVLLYAGICTLLLLRLGRGLWAAARLWNTAEPVSPASCAQVRSANTRASARVSSPVTVGAGIVLPADYAAWDAEKLRIVLAHEESHVRQRDFYLQLAASLYAAVFWFSPLGWWLKRKLSDLSETISDGAALDHAASHASYAQVLLEFAALPRPLPIGVAMAHHGRLIPRIERLLNENSFRQAFAGGRGRVAAAVLLVPVALFAATALVRVEAAGPHQAPDPAKAPAAPAQVADTPQPPAPAAPAIAAGPKHPAPAGQGVVAPAAPDSPVLAPVSPDGPAPVATPQAAPSVPSVPAPPAVRQSGSRHGYSYSYSSNGDSYALVSGNEDVTFSGDWYEGRKAEFDKARRMAHGDFLWFRRNGKSYVMDDPAIVAEVKAMYAPMEALGKQQEELGKLQEELGRRQEALGTQQEEASVPTPEMTHEMAEVEAAVAALKAAKGTALTADKLADMQSKLADLQAKLGEMQGAIGEKQGALGEKQGALGEQQGKLGEQQGKLGEQQGRLAAEADKKVKSIIDQSLKNGKARPLE